MASIGLSKPYVATYAVSNGNVVYSGGRLAGKAVTLDIALDDATDNILYGDNGPAEVDGRFSGGSLTLTTTELEADVIAMMLGVQEVSLSIQGMTTQDASEVKFGDGQTVPYMGFGAIAKKMIDGDIKWVGIVWPKVKFQNIDDSYETQGDEISWKTPEIKATIMRDDTSEHNWKRRSSELDSEEDALLYIQSILGVAGGGSQ